MLIRVLCQSWVGGVIVNNNNQQTNNNFESSLDNAKLQAFKEICLPIDNFIKLIFKNIDISRNKRIRRSSDTSKLEMCLYMLDGISKSETKHCFSFIKQYLSPLINIIQIFSDEPNSIIQKGICFLFVFFFPLSLLVL